MDCVLFRGIPEREIRLLLRALAKEKRFAKGEIIYSPQDFKRSLGIICKGSVVAQKENGVILNRMGAGDCFGAAALFSQGEEYVTTVLAQQDCRILFLSDCAVQKIVEQSPKIAINYIRFLSDRIRFLNQRIDSFTADDAQQALLSYLEQQPNRCSDGIAMAKLAEALNMGRTSLYRAVGELEKQGRIKKEGKKITLLTGKNFPKNQ